MMYYTINNVVIYVILQLDEELSPPKKEDYEHFQNYIATKTIERTEEEKTIERTEDESEEEEDAHGLELQGMEDLEPREYNEPPFPPQQPRCEDEPSNTEIKSRLTVEGKAQEWCARFVFSFDVCYSLHQCVAILHRTLHTVKTFT